jgi:phenylalanyl-tRNA synthetase beta chain
MAVIVDESLPVRRIEDAIWQLHEPMLEQVEIFDIYRNPQLGAGKKSIGYRLVYRSAERSLTDAEVNEMHGTVVERVLKYFHATLRS